MKVLLQRLALSYALFGTATLACAGAVCYENPALVVITILTLIGGMAHGMASFIQYWHDNF